MGNHEFHALSECPEYLSNWNTPCMMISVDALLNKLNWPVESVAKTLPRHDAEPYENMRIPDYVVTYTEVEGFMKIVNGRLARVRAGK